MVKTKKEWIDLYTAIANYKGQEEKFLTPNSKITLQSFKTAVKWAEKIINKHKTNKQTKKFLFSENDNSNKYSYDSFLVNMGYRDTYYSYRLNDTLKEKSTVHITFSVLFTLIKENKQVEAFAVW